jgi:hypothetical protein
VVCVVIRERVETFLYFNHEIKFKSNFSEFPRLYWLLLQLYSFFPEHLVSNTSNLCSSLMATFNNLKAQLYVVYPCISSVCPRILATLFCHVCPGVSLATAAAEAVLCLHTNCTTIVEMQTTRFCFVSVLSGDTKQLCSECDKTHLSFFRNTSCFLSIVYNKLHGTRHSVATLCDMDS